MHPPRRVEDRFGAVRRVSLALRAAGIAHALGGGALRWSLGIADGVRDWDLTCDAPEELALGALASFDPQRIASTLPYRSAYLYRLHLEGEIIEVIGDFTIATPGGCVRIPTRVAAWAHGLPLARASDWARAYRALGCHAEANALAASNTGETLAAPLPIDPSRTPDLLTRTDGRRIQTAAEWHERGSAWRQIISDALYGPLPAEPVSLDYVLSARARVPRLPGSPWLSTYRLRAHVRGAAIPLTLQLLRPDHPEPLPVLLEGDAGWWAPGDELVSALLERKVALARLDRTEVAYDQPTPDARPRGPLPELLGDGATGAIGHWAWALRRGLDVLTQLDGVDPDRLALSGFSRGGKAALLAGSWDARARVVHAHASGAGGAASSRCTPLGAETLHDVVTRFPHWFAPGAAALAAAPHRLPFDQHALLAAVAPRTLILTCGLGDRWANPGGTARSVAHAAPAFALCDALEAMVWRVRPGGHTVEAADWTLVADAL